MRYFFTLAALLSLSPAFSDPLAAPLSETQKSMTSPESRSQIIQVDPKARAADEQVKALAGTPENTDEIYRIAADIMGNLVNTTGGDTKGMEEILQKAMQDPAGFHKTFTPEQQKAIRDLGSKIEAEKKKTP